jgi:hypothetical protein
MIKKEVHGQVFEVYDTDEIKKMREDCSHKWEIVRGSKIVNPNREWVKGYGPLETVYANVEVGKVCKKCGLTEGDVYLGSMSLISNT